RFRTDFRWLARALGEVRDLDVYRDRLRGQSGLLDPALQSALGPFEDALEKQHGVARTELARTLASDRYEQLIRDFARWVHRGPSAAAWRRWSSLTIRDGAPDYIDAAIRRVRKCGRRIDGDSPPGELHDLRIRVKRLRYLMEIFAPVYGNALAKRSRQVRQLQDTLGAYQDACVAMTQLEARSEQLQARSEATDELEAIEKLCEIEQASAAAARKRFARDWRGFATQFDRAEIRRILSH
ncbi:MAG TPA: CHAD domain-containing protein, partial [Steroidobacteraceae bacterium]|nr:CHAD domain-containing protein [Steroidobacteraceae bacterium]